MKNSAKNTVPLNASSALVSTFSQNINNTTAIIRNLTSHSITAKKEHAEQSIIKARKAASENSNTKSSATENSTTETEIKLSLLDESATENSFNLSLIENINHTITPGHSVDWANNNNINDPKSPTISIENAIRAMWYIISLNDEISPKLQNITISPGLAEQLLPIIKIETSQEDRGVLEVLKNVLVSFGTISTYEENFAAYALNNPNTPSHNSLNSGFGFMDSMTAHTRAKSIDSNLMNMSNALVITSHKREGSIISSQNERREKEGQPHNLANITLSDKEAETTQNAYAEIHSLLIIPSDEFDDRTQSYYFTFCKQAPKIKKVFIEKLTEQGLIKVKYTERSQKKDQNASDKNEIDLKGNGEKARGDSFVALVTSSGEYNKTKTGSKRGVTCCVM